MNVMLRPVDAVHDANVGGKARALASASEAGLPVPPFFVVTASQAGNTATRVGDGQAMLDAALGLLGDTTFAVRSSALDEDAVRQSFAGQFDSVIDVARGDLGAAIEQVQVSASSERAVAYRTHSPVLSGGRAVPHAVTAPVGVIVQRMVHPIASGVAFTADPITGQRGVTIVTAVRGHCASLVTGLTNADTWRLDRSGTVLERRLTTGSPALSDEQLQRVAALARRSASHFGTPQDVEWALDTGQLWLLQSRPITSLATLPDPDCPATLWDNSNIVESYGGVTTPLTFSFVSDVYEHVYRQFCHVMHVPAARIADADEAFRNMLGLLHGRLYYNLGNWYRVLALLPGFTLNRPFMEEMMGVRDAAPAELLTAARPGRSARWLDGLHLLRTLAALCRQHWNIDRSVVAFRRRLTRTLATPAVPLDEMRPDELVAHYRTLRRHLLLAWDAPIVNDFLAMVFHGALRSLGRTWCADEDGSMVNQLLTGQRDLASAEPAIHLRRLADLARPDEALVALLDRAALPEIRAAIGARPAFASEYASYLEQFGERTLNELKLETLTLHDDPMPLLRAIAKLAQRPGETDHAGDRTSDDVRLRRTVTGGPVTRLIRRRLIEWLAAHARARVRDRELLRLDRMRLFGRVRRIVVQMGRRLHEADALDEPRDVFYLTMDELLGFVERRSVCRSLRALVAVRRQEFSAYAAQDPPPGRLLTRGMADVVGSGLDSTDFSRSGPTRVGLGCSRGRVTGRVHVVRDPSTTVIDGRAVLVATHTDPGWILLFPSALAVVAERGSVLSHTAIVAREFGIPAVVSLPGATSWLADDDWVEVDGATGTVRKLEGRVS